MTAPAITSVIEKPGKYLNIFIELMREGSEVPFVDEEVPTRRIYKDGAAVKKILAVLDDLIQTGIDVNDPAVLYDIFREEGGRELYRKIEFQSLITNKIETHIISKIGKQIISGRGGGKSIYEGKESDWPESLQCVALAYRQSENGNITEAGFKGFLLKGRNGDAEVIRILENNVFARQNMNKKLLFKYGLENADWIKSSVNVANALYASNKYLKTSITYEFHHATSPDISWFKSKFREKFSQVMANKLRQEGYGSSVDSDKWNPADMVAIKKQTTEQKVEREITTKDFFKAGDYAKYDKKNKKSVLATDEKVKEEFAELTRYNNWIHQNILSGEFVPISLKKTLNNARVDLISNPSIQEYSVDVGNIKVDWKPEAQKIIINFDVTYTFIIGNEKKKETKKTSYFFDCRNFGMGTNVQFELGIDGSSAKHGKISTGPAEMIIDLTSPVFRTLLEKTRKDFVKIMETPNVRMRYFPKLDSPPSANALKAFIEEVVNKRRPHIFIINENINEVAKNSGWIKLLECYLIYLSRRYTYNISGDENRKKNYFKSKLAAVELGWMMTSRAITPILRNVILKSLYLYASSQGLQIFSESGLLKKSYFYNSSYVKVRD